MPTIHASRSYQQRFYHIPDVVVLDRYRLVFQTCCLQTVGNFVEHLGKSLCGDRLSLNPALQNTSEPTHDSVEGTKETRRGACHLLGELKKTCHILTNRLNWCKLRRTH